MGKQEGLRLALWLAALSTHHQAFCGQQLSLVEGCQPIDPWESCGTGGNLEAPLGLTGKDGQDPPGQAEVCGARGSLAVMHGSVASVWTRPCCEQ